MAQDSVNQVVTKAVIRNNTGNLQIYQCRPRITTRHAVSQHVKDFNRLTIGDVLQHHRIHQQMYHTVLFS